MDFVPAVSWAGFNPAGRGRLVLRAVCSPPRKLTFEDSLKLTVADLTEFKKVSNTSSSWTHERFFKI